MSSTSSAFEKLEGNKARKFIDRLNKAWRGSPFDAERTVVHARGLSFANDWVLAESSDATTLPEKRCVALDNGQECVPIEFTPDFIPAFAGKHAFVLDDDSAPDYLRFWFEYVRGGAERFLLVEAIDDMPWREEPTPQARKALAKSVIPMEHTNTTQDGFTFRACVLFRDTLFETSVLVSPAGNVAFTARTPLAEGLTVTDALTGF